jgi:hypothetical protein
MSEVEIFWPETLPTEALLDGAAVLREDGVATTCRLQPVRRNATMSVLVLLTTTALDPILKAVFSHVGGSAWKALQRFVRKLFSDDADGATPKGNRPEVVVFESTSTGAQFVFTANMSASAFRQAIELDPGEAPGRWVWHDPTDKWIRFEEVSTS